MSSLTNKKLLIPFLQGRPTSSRMANSKLTLRLFAMVVNQQIHHVIAVVIYYVGVYHFGNNLVQAIPVRCLTRILGYEFPPLWCTTFHILIKFVLAKWASFQTGISDASQGNVSMLSVLLTRNPRQTCLIFSRKDSPISSGNIFRIIQSANGKKGNKGLSQASSTTSPNVYQVKLCVRVTESHYLPTNYFRVLSMMVLGNRWRDELTTGVDGVTPCWVIQHIETVK
jgi:hypothetical protein